MTADGAPLSPQAPRAPRGRAADHRVAAQALALRADGVAVPLSRGGYPLATVAQALATLQAAGLAVWLVGLEWRPPRGPARLRRVRQLLPGIGEWGTARQVFCAAWRDQHRRQRPKAPTAKDCGNLRGND